jgi:hypothetical protein
MDYVPKGVASGMMAGILVPFGLNAFKGTNTLPLLSCGMIAAYLVFRRCYPRYSIVLLLAAGTVIAMLAGQTHFSDVRLELVTPQFIAPAWTWTSTFSLALPLVVVTLTGQYLPGMTGGDAGRPGAAGTHRGEPHRNRRGRRSPGSLRDYFSRNGLRHDLPRAGLRVLGNRHRHDRLQGSTAQIKTS